jgi:hypothetical protein
VTVAADHPDGTAPSYSSSASQVQLAVWQGYEQKTPASTTPVQMELQSLDIATAESDSELDNSPG